MPGESYRSAGVDLEAASKVKKSIQAYSRSTYGPQVLDRDNSFAGLYRLQGYKEPVLVASIDPVGTKLKVAAYLGRYESLGVDLVNLNINDILTCGAKPLFFLDYISMGRLEAQIVDELVRGMAQACREAQCALIGGDTPQMPGLYQKGAFDLVGFVVGAVERTALLDTSRIVEGDLLVGVPSSGLHTNGFSLVRQVYKIDENPKILDRHYQELGHTLGEELLTPHLSYYPMLEPILPLLKGMAHITGGGLLENLPRILPDGLAARVSTDAWEVPAIFQMVQREGGIESDEMYRVFNMGLGMVLVSAPDQVAEVQRLLPEARVVGEVVPQRDEGRVVIEESST